MAEAEELEEGWRSFTSVERAMARRMERATQMAISTEFTHVDVAAAQAETARLKAEGWPITFNSLVVIGVARSLAKFPEVASVIDYENWRRRVPEAPNVGIAVASERGLVVPVIREPGNKSGREIVDELAGIVRDVRAGAADAALFKDGHFSITNIGNQPIYGGVPLPNVPQPAILGVSGFYEAPVVRDGEIVATTLGRLTIAIDHRALEGMAAAGFLTSMKELLEDPGRLTSS